LWRIEILAFPLFSATYVDVKLGSWGVGQIAGKGVVALRLVGRRITYAPGVRITYAAYAPMPDASAGAILSDPPHSVFFQPLVTRGIGLIGGIGVSLLELIGRGPHFPGDACRVSTKPPRRVPASPSR
jgi:hypothetical protein